MLWGSKPEYRVPVGAYNGPLVCGIWPFFITFGLNEVKGYAPPLELRPEDKSYWVSYSCSDWNS